MALFTFTNNGFVYMAGTTMRHGNALVVVYHGKPRPTGLYAVVCTRVIIATGTGE